MSTNVSIYTLNTSLIQNRDFKDYTNGYYAKTEGARKVYLYASQVEQPAQIKTASTPLELTPVNITRTLRYNPKKRSRKSTRHIKQKLLFNKHRNRTRLGPPHQNKN